MNFFKYLKMIKTALPYLRSVFKAYKETTGKSKQGSKHPFDNLFSSFMSKTNMSAPPLTESTAAQILNIDKSLEQIDAKIVLQRYYVLFKKNDPKSGGTTYLQSKVYAAKECLMARFPDAERLQQEFYKEIVEPEQKAEQEANLAKNKEKVEEDEKARQNFKKQNKE